MITGHASWVILLLGLFMSASVCKSFGNNWGDGLIASFKVLLVAAPLAFLSAIISLTLRRSILGGITALLSGMALVPLLLVFFDWLTKVR